MTPSDHDRIAIVGLGGRFPGAVSLREFWANLLAGRESVRFHTEDELRAAGVPADLLTGPGYVPASVEPPDLEYFDAELFGFTPRDAAVLDPQIRMFLDSAHSAIEHAGYDPHRIPDTGVFGTVGMNRYLDMHVLRGYQAGSTAGLATGTLSYADYTATQLSYRFGFRGPALAVSSACSSSALAVHLACQALLAGECDFAVAGGAELEVPVHHGYRWDAGGPLSQDGHCRPFDADATGTIFGSGAGAVLLKRYGDAIADHDSIWAVIRASAVNNDGAAKAGFSAPGLAGQIAVVTEALQVADVSPADISYVEAHATGTALGDPIEVSALSQAFAGLGRGADDGEPVVLSSIKGNVGHLGHASGIVSLIKLCLALRHEQLPPTANFARANPRLELDRTPFEVRAEVTPWPRQATPRRAGLNSLGIGGTNVHLIIEEAPVPAAREVPTRPQLFVWSAGSTAGAERLRDALADAVDELDPAAVGDLAATLQEGRTVHTVRGAVVADVPDAAAALRDAPPVLRGAGARRGTAFLFPGQGAQHVGMARTLIAARPDFAAHLDACLDRFAALPDGLALPELRAALTADDAGAAARLADTAIAQPLLFSIGYALAQFWADLGVRPDVVLGHSLGELTAAAVAGVLDLDDAVAVVAARATAMSRMPRGAMLSVRLPHDELRARLRDGTVVAVVNDPRATTLAGPTEAVRALAAELAAEGVTTRILPTSHAFHCELMSPAVEQFLPTLQRVRLRTPEIRLVSAAAGAVITDAATEPRFWAEQLVRPVRFDQGLAQLLSGDPLLLLELGPGHTLTALAKGTEQVRSGASVAYPCLAPAAQRDRTDDEKTFLRAAGAVWAEGGQLDWQRLRLGEAAHRIPVPGYPYERKRHWIELATDAATDSAPAAPVDPPVTPAPAEEAVSGTAFSEPVWARVPALPPASRRMRTALVLVPDGDAYARPVVLALQRGGCRVVVARPGHELAEDGTGWRVRPDHPDDLDAVLTALAARTGTPDLVVHALALAPWPGPDLTSIDQQLRQSVHSVRGWAQVLARRVTGTELIVLTDGAADVSGAETAHPAKATLPALARSLAEETADVRCRLVDIATASCQSLVLATELATPGTDPVVALRGARRWVRTEVPIEEPATAALGDLAIREHGVYVLTGGCGGLGLAVARALGETGTSPHLVLTTRREPATIPAADLETIRATGASVEVRRCDVTDAHSMRRLFDAIRAEHGMVHGVVHLAGLPGDAVLLRRSAEATDAVLAPKVHGTLALAEALAGQAATLDFLIGFSSRAALTGLVGGADYAAANAFLDAAFVGMARSGLSATTVNWPAWSEVGMAARPVPASADTEPDVRRWETVVGVDNWPILDEHRIAGTPILPGTAQLDLVLQAYYAVVATEAGPARFEEVVFQEVLDGSADRCWSCEFTPSGPEWTFVARSRPSAAPEGVAATVHVTGRVGPAAAAPAADGVLARLLDEMRDADLTDARTDPGGFQLGPRWAVVESTTLREHDAGQRLVRLCLPAAFQTELSRHAVYPTLLDAATTEVRQPDGDGLALPFRYGTLTVFEPFPARVLSHIQRRPSTNGSIVADVDIYAEDGRRLAVITEFTMRPFRADRLSQVTSEPQADAAPPATSDDGIDPRIGGELFLAVLAGPRREQIAVRPYRSGRPIPLGSPDVVALRQSDQAPTVPSVAVATAPERPAPPDASPDSGAGIAERLAALWGETLGEKPEDSDRDFFELGGNSLSAVELMNTINAEFGIRLSVIALFDSPTLNALADVVREAAEVAR
ncbi:MAG TPA: SDR family oxidoreductase [Pseudonocardiaceae bacterium]